MASGEAEPLQYTTTVLRVSIHCEGCKKKVKKVLQNIEGVYKVAIDAAQHKVTVTSSVGADVLVRRLHKSGKHATVWPSPPVAAAAKQKPDEVAAAPPPAAAPAPAGERGKGAEKKAKEAAKEAGSESSEKKPEKEKKAEAKKPAKDDAAKKEGEVPEKEKGSPEPNKESARRTPRRRRSQLPRRHRPHPRRRCPLRRQRCRRRSALTAGSRTTRRSR